MSITLLSKPTVIDMKVNRPIHDGTSDPNYHCSYTLSLFMDIIDCS